MSQSNKDMESQKVGDFALVTLDYPPARGGVARYLGNLADASGGLIDVYSKTLASLGLLGWWSLIGFMMRLKKAGYHNIIISHVVPVGTAAWIASLFTGLKYTVIVHGLDLRLVSSSPRRRWLVNRIMENASCVIANSEFVSRLAKELAPRARVEVVTPGVETIQFPTRQEARSRLKLSADAQIVLSVARLVPRKGIDVLIQSMQSFPVAELIVVGDGDDLTRLQKLAIDKKVQVRFVREANDEERNNWYAAADCFALPVRNEGLDVEGFGIVYLEAASAGLPVIAGKSGGAAEAVADGLTGLVVEPTVEGVTDALRRLLTNPTLRHRYGEQGKIRAERDFSWRDRWNQIQSLLN